MSCDEERASCGSAPAGKGLGAVKLGGSECEAGGSVLTCLFVYPSLLMFIWVSYLSSPKLSFIACQMRIASCLTHLRWKLNETTGEEDIHDRKELLRYQWGCSQGPKAITAQAHTSKQER